MFVCSKWKLAGGAAMCAALLIGSAPVSAAEITMISAMALHATYTELAQQYEKMSGDKVTIIWSPGLEVTKHVQSGEKADFAVLGADGVDDLIQKGFLAPGSRVPLARSLIGIAIRPGSPRPDLSSGNTLKASLLASRKIALSNGTSSLYLKKMFQKMGIGDQMEAKIYRSPNGRGENVSNVLRRGDADLGFQQVSEFIDEPGIELIGPISSDVQDVTVWSAGMYRDAPHPDAAKAFIRFLTSAQAAAVLKKHGLDPGA